MSMQISEDLKGETSVVILGINTRGFYVGAFLSQILADALRIPIPCHRVSVQNDTEPFGNDIIRDIREARYILLVDDVLFSGSTMLAAIRSVLDVAEPDKMRMAVVIDRGHRRYPVQPDFVGLISPTKFKEHVELQFDADNYPQSVMLTEL